MNPNTHFFTTPVSPLRFFFITFFLSWVVWIPLVFSHFGIVLDNPESTSAIVRLLGVSMVAVSALTSNWFSPSRVSFLLQDTAPLIVNMVFLMIAVLGEEISWHGAALPALQQKYSALKSTPIVGFWWDGS